MGERKKYLIITAVFLVFYLAFLHYQLITDLGYDEARHANQGHIMYDYVKHLLSGNFVGFYEFVMEDYITVHNGLDWYALYDPPVHAISQAIMFLLIGPSQYAARLTTMLWSVLGAFLVFLLAEKVFKSPKYAFTTTALFMLFPITFDLARQSMLTIPIAVCTAGWFYFFFYKEGKLALALSTLFLLLGSLMKYQTAIFAAAFFILYFLFISYQKWKSAEEKDLGWFFILKTNKELIKKIIIQFSLCFIFALPWFLTSFYKTGVLTKLVEAGVVEVQGSSNPLLYRINFIWLAIKDTFFVALVALIPVIFFRKSELLKKHKELLIFIIAVFLAASFLITNKKFRYMIHVLPFIAIFAVEGVRTISSFIQEKFKVKYLFWIFTSIIAIVLMIANVGVANEMVKSYGVGSNDVWEYLEKQKSPKMVLLQNVGFSESYIDQVYYHSEDLTQFKALLLEKESNPKEMEVFVMRVTLSEGKNYESALTRLLSIFEFYPRQPNTYAVILKSAYYSDVGKDISRIYQEAGFQPKEFTNYVLLEKLVKRNPTKLDPLFPPKSNQQKALTFRKKGESLLEQNNFREAAQYLKRSFQLNPFDMKTGASLSIALNAEAEALWNQGEYEVAIKTWQQALEISPSYEKVKQNLKLALNQNT